MRRYLIAGNWKMNKTISEAKALATQIVKELKDVTNLDIAIFPPFTAIFEVYKIIKDSNIGLGAQNIWYEPKGAYTGEISVPLIVDAGCRYVIIGHSERRKYFKENGDLINRKVKASINGNLTPIVCIGETLEERERGDAFQVLETQINELAGIDFSKIVIAYEPVWAIGTGKTATPATAEEAHKFIRGLVQSQAEVYHGNSDIAENIRILYGGSVTPENIEGLISEPDIDGVLVGGASLDASSFISIVKKCTV